jgi:ATP-dependent Lon protease
MDLTTFKNYNTTRADLDDLVAMAAFGRALRTEYEAHQIEEPEFVSSKLKSLRAEIADRNADKIASRKAEIKARLDSLKSPKEKAAELRKELEALETVGA